MPALSLAFVTINAVDPRRIAEFYATLLGGEIEAYDESFLVVKLDGPVSLHVQCVDTPAAQPGWVHLDFEAGDRDETIRAVLDAGGSLVETRGDEAFSWVVMTDPEGNPFCF